MPTIEQLQARLDALRTHRAGPASEVQVAPDGGVRVVYKDDAALAAAIADLERQVAAAGGAPVHTIHISASKGLDT